MSPSWCQSINYMQKAGGSSLCCTAFYNVKTNFVLERYWSANPGKGHLTELSCIIVPLSLAVITQAQHPLQTCSNKPTHLFSSWAWGLFHGNRTRLAACIYPLASSREECWAGEEGWRDGDGEARLGCLVSSTLLSEWMGSVGASCSMTEVWTWRLSGWRRETAVAC